MPKAHIKYLQTIKDINPKVIYDIGACVLHWTKPAKATWPEAKIIAFDIMEEARFLYNSHNIEYHVHFLSDKDEEEKEFFKNIFQPGGQSFYRENPAILGMSSQYFSDKHKIKVKTITLDTLVSKLNLPAPDLIKMDIQGSELDVLKGALNTISNCKDIILELQEIDWNMGAPKADIVIEYMNSIGYDCVASKFSKNSADADYHFKKIL
jgi:FkbM family methyltransferase